MLERMEVDIVYHYSESIECNLRSVRITRVFLYFVDRKKGQCFGKRQGVLNTYQAQEDSK